MSSSREAASGDSGKGDGGGLAPFAASVAVRAAVGEAGMSDGRGEVTREAVRTRAKLVEGFTAV